MNKAILKLASEYIRMRGPYERHGRKVRKALKSEKIDNFASSYLNERIQDLASDILEDAKGFSAGKGLTKSKVKAYLRAT